MKAHIISCLLIFLFIHELVIRSVDGGGRVPTPSPPNPNLRIRWKPLPKPSRRPPPPTSSKSYPP
ncbi:hypothetical protein H5410_020041 [Solanum commersonii]|uniref:Transmembrane protein n=1 Tax=Solanum commersonii TaxID=4109 RepID=A0A9J5ZA20_SOLCO|nr:hypothetical protein H5410_020041 [Solanum commersonii]